MEQVIGFCEVCKCNKYKNASGDIICRCGNPLPKKKVIVESKYICKRCKTEITIVGKSKINGNKKFCDICKVINKNELRAKNSLLRKIAYAKNKNRRHSKT